MAPRPLTAANRAFRSDFYARWGKENAVVLGCAQRAEFAPFTQSLSVKRSWGGPEDSVTDCRRLRVDDAHFLVLNAGQTYGAVIQSPTPVHSLAVFLRPGMAEEYTVSQRLTLPQALAAEATVTRPHTEFSEHLRPRDPGVDACLLHIRNAVAAGQTDTWWLEEQLQNLLQAMHRSEQRWAQRALALQTSSRSNHLELQKRVDMATDYLLSHACDAIDLDQLAKTARLSKYHLVRVFQTVHGNTPFEFLAQTRMRRASQLIAAGQHTLDQVAHLCGLGTRFTLYRQLQKRRPARQTR